MKKLLFLFFVLNQSILNPKDVILVRNNINPVFDITVWPVFKFKDLAIYHPDAKNGIKSGQEVVLNLDQRTVNIESENRKAIVDFSKPLEIYFQGQSESCYHIDSLDRPSIFCASSDRQKIQLNSVYNVTSEKLKLNPDEESDSSAYKITFNIVGGYKE